MKKLPGLLLCLLVLALVWSMAHALDVEMCKLPLGMQTMGIPDSALYASSMQSPDLGPTSARVRTEIGGGAWCPKDAITKGSNEYLQVDLGELKAITVVETQGRFAGQGEEFTDQYKLEYQREPGGPWFRFRNRRQQEIISGNTNSYIADMRQIDPPIIARKIKFIPYSNHPKRMCLRVELYGCTWTDGTVSYDMQQGERRGTEVDLYDLTYDGTYEVDYLSGGLGQLTDGAEGQANFRLDPDGLGIKGYEWIGWKNESFGQQAVELTFKFDQLRNFSHVTIHSNNFFSKDVRVFKKALLYFSEDGDDFLQTPAHEFNYMRDTIMEYARSVLIPVPNLIGQYVKIRLFFDAKWLMISEVQFDSEPADIHASLLASSTPYVPRDSKNKTPLPDFVKVIDLPSETGFNQSIPPHHRKPGKKGEDRSGAGSMQKDTGNAQEVANVKPHDGEVPPSTESNVVDAKTRNSLDDEYIGIIIGTLAALILVLFAVILVIILRHRRRKYNNNHRAMKSIEPRHVTLNLNDLNVLNGSMGKNLSNGNMYNCVATSEEGESDRDDTTTTSRDYAVPSDLTKTLLRNPSSQLGAFTPSSTLPRPLPVNPAYQDSLFRPNHTAASPQLPAPYASTDVIAPNIQGINDMYAPPNALDVLWKDDTSVMEIPRDSIKSIEKLGEGQFGEVHLCEVVPELYIEDMGPNGQGMRPALLAAKMLRQNASEQARADFHKEVKIMSRLKDPNIVRVLGVITKDEPLSVLVEYMECGDLHQFLRQHSFDTCSGTMTRKRNSKLISHGTLVFMATQISSGMKYLEALNMVHRDLATRNCLVGQNYNIKIADFGMSRSLYSSDYYKIEGNTVLPIRWMAWESLLLGKFSTKSDVWSFGVTLWEVLTLAKEHPYEGLSDEQVIANCNQCYLGNGLDIVLPQPANCPREVYDLMAECWNRDEVARPSFREIHMFLQRKNMGYFPQGERTLGKNGIV